MNWDKPQIIETSINSLEIDNLPRSLSRAIDSCSKAFQVPADFALLVLCSVVAAATRGKYAIRVKPDWCEPLSLYVAPLLEPSNRKSAVIGFATKPLREQQSKLRSDHLEAEQIKARDREIALARKAKLLKESKAKPSEALLAEIAELDTTIKKCKEARTPSILIDDTTPEALVEQICDQRSIAYIEAEGQLIDNLSRYSESQSPNVEALNKCYSSEPISVSRKGKDLIYADNPHLVICIGAQPSSVLPKLKNESFEATGFNARFLYLLGKSQIGSRSFSTPPISEAVKAEWLDLISLIYKQSEQGFVKELKIDPEALESIEQLHNWLEPQMKPMSQSLKNWAGKLVGNLIRIAAIFQLAENPRSESISRKTIDQALGLAPLFLQHAEKVFSPDTSEQPLLRVLRKLCGGGFEGFEGVTPDNSKIFTTNKLFQAMKDQAFFSKSANPARLLRSLLWQLEELGWLRHYEVEQSSSNGGRPSEKWELHPDAINYFEQLFN